MAARDVHSPIIMVNVTPSYRNVAINSSIRLVVSTGCGLIPWLPVLKIYPSLLSPYLSHLHGWPFSQPSSPVSIRPSLLLSVGEKLLHNLQPRTASKNLQNWSRLRLSTVHFIRVLRRMSRNQTLLSIILHHQCY